MFNIFIAESILKQVIETEGKKPEASRSYLYKLMRMKLMKKVYVSAETPDAAWAKTLEEQHKIKAEYSKSDYIRGIKDHPETVLQYPSSIFILDIPLKDAMDIQTLYGVICLCGENANINRLVDINDEQTIGDQESLGNGWSTVLKSLKGIPSNALLLTDRYLFSGYYAKAGNGVDNVLSILETLLPEKFLGEYHVTIVFDNENKNEKYASFNDIVTQLSTIRQALHRDYPINMEILGITPDCEVYNDLHNRRIVSNYFIVKVEHKMAAFNKNISTCEQTITPQVLFTVDSLNKNSTPPLKAIDHVIAAIRKFSRIASRSTEANDYFYALNDKRMERCTGIKNRLLKLHYKNYCSNINNKRSFMAILTNNQHIAKYEVIRLIKENNYCETYRVEDEKGEPFFLKLFILKNTPEKMLNEDHKVTCIEIMSKLRHKNIISYVEQGVYQDDAVGDCIYAITNYFSGELLADKLLREGSLPIEEAVRITKDVLEGLKYMHEHNLFHNDITPRNVMLSERTGGTAELIDMSHVSKYVSGSPTFDTSDLDERYQSNITFAGIYHNATDLFSIVALFYTMLTNRVPWGVEIPEGTDRKERIKIVKEARKTPLSLDDLKIEEGFKRILQKGLSINGTCKYADAESLIGDLQNPNRVNELEQPNQAEQPRQQSSSNNNVVDEEKQATEAKVDIKKGKGNGFKDIAGMDGLKQMLTQKVIFILKDKEKAAKYKLLPPNGMLFYGPPGCGKSFFAEKFAEETGFNFMLVKASDLGSIYVHGSQGKIADLFKKAEESKPTVICFDEFDAFVPNRSNTGAEHQAGEVNEFLSQLNNCAQRGIFVIATSNRPDMIDPAVLRTGRIDKIVYIPMPDKEARSEMFKLHLSGRPCSDIDAEHLAEMTDGYIASDIAYIVNDAAMGAAFSDQPISQELLEATINSIRPSISKEVVNTYENLRRKMEDTNARNERPKIGFVQ